MVFIVIDGTDGSGKGTQITLLQQRLESEGFKVKIADFPRYGNPSAQFVEHYLDGQYVENPKDMHPEVASLFYALDRKYAATEIQDWLDNNYIVLSNRYVSASKGHQLGKLQTRGERLKFLEWLNDFEYNFMGVVKEDLTIFLRVPPTTSQSNVDKKETRSYTDKKRDIHERDTDHLAESLNGFDFTAEIEHWPIITCTNEEGVMKSREAITEEIYNIIKPRLQNIQEIKIK